MGRGYLQRDRRWRLVFFDDVASLFVRVRPGEVLPYPEIDLDGPNRFPPIEGSDTARNTRRLGLRTFALLSLGRPELALEEWEHAIALVPDMAHREFVRARLLDEVRAQGNQR